MFNCFRLSSKNNKLENFDNTNQNKKNKFLQEVDSSVSSVVKDSMEALADSFIQPMSPVRYEKQEQSSLVEKLPTQIPIIDLLIPDNRLHWARTFHHWGPNFCNNEQLIKALPIEDKDLVSSFLLKFIKDLGNEWELNCHTNIEEERISAFGSTPEKALAELCSSLTQFYQQADLSTVPAKIREIVVKSLKEATLLAVSMENIPKALEDFERGMPIIIATGWKGHGTFSLLYRGLYAYANVGETATQSDGKMLQSGIRIYDIGNLENVNEQFLEKLLLRSQDPEGVEARKTWLDAGGINKDLDLTNLLFIPLPDGLSPNCCWANSSALLIPLIHLLRLDMAGLIEDPFELANPQHLRDVYIELSKWKTHSHFQIYKLFKTVLNHPLMDQLMSRKNQFSLFCELNQKITENNSIFSPFPRFKSACKDFLKSKKLTFLECAINLNLVGENRLNYIRDLLMGQEPGAFIITLSPARETLHLHYINPLGEFAEIILKQDSEGYELDGKVFSTLHELMDDKAASELTFPVFSENLAMKYST